MDSPNAELFEQALHFLRNFEPQVAGTENDRLESAEQLAKYALAFLNELGRYLKGQNWSDESISDLKGETLLRLIKYPPEIPGGNPTLFRGWLRATLLSRVAERLGQVVRRRNSLGREMSLEANNDGSSGYAAFVPAVFDDQTFLWNLDLELALLELAPRDRRIYELRFRESKEPDEIADLVGVNVSTIRRRIKAIDKRLRQSLGQDS